MNSAISPGYLRTLNLALVAGRDFGPGEPPDGPPVAIVNETAAKRLWPGRNPIGQRVLLGCRDAFPLEVVGVARDSKFVSLGEPPNAHIYRPLSQDSGGLETILVETASDPGAMAETVRKTIAAANPDVRIYGVKQLREWVDQSYWQVRWEVWLLSAFAGLALVLAAVGLYGVIAYHVTLRTREIGIRGAVGASPRDIFRLVIRQGLSLTLAGVAIGLVLAAGLARLMAGVLYGVSPADPPTYAAVTLLWLAVAVAACYLPARRASRVDPISALRYE
jgi:putative ABC transport system permease protein